MSTGKKIIRFTGPYPTLFFPAVIDDLSGVPGLIGDVDGDFEVVAYSRYGTSAGGDSDFLKSSEFTITVKSEIARRAWELAFSDWYSSGPGSLSNCARGMG